MNGKVMRALQSFLAFRKVKGVAACTLSDYSYFIGRYARILGDNEDYREAVLSFLSQKDINNTTFNMRLSYLKCFFSWCIEEGIFTCENPLRGIKKRPAVHRVVNITVEEIMKLLSSPDKGTFCGLRDYSWIMLALDTAIRPSEARQLLESDFDLEHGYITIRAEISKVRKERILPISEATINTVRELLNVRHRAWSDDTTVFCSNSGKVLSRGDLAKNFKKYTSKIKGKNITPYSLRHCAALSHLRGGMNAFTLQSLMGHSSPAMTQRYLNITAEDIKAAHDKSSVINLIAPPAQKLHRVGRIS